MHLFISAFEHSLLALKVFRYCVLIEEWALFVKAAFIFFVWLVVLWSCKNGNFFSFYLFKKIISAL